jgi:hypothetical protein
LKLYAYGVRQQANEWGVGRGADRTWSARKKKKESKTDVPVSMRRQLILDRAMMWGGSGHPICVVSTSYWRREVAARGCRNRDPQGSWHVGHTGGWDKYAEGGKSSQLFDQGKK